MNALKTISFAIFLYFIPLSRDCSLTRLSISMVADLKY